MKIKGVHSIDSQQSELLFWVPCAVQYHYNKNTITVIQSNPVKKDTEGATESAHINGLSILSRLN